MGKKPKYDEEYEAFKASMKNRSEVQETFHQKLQAACPLFWRKNSPGGMYALPSVCSGWHDIIFECSCKIEKALQSVHGILTPEMMPYPAQIKEKFGELRFYYDRPYDLPEEILQEIEEAIAEAENKSCTTCEYCASPDATLRSQTPEGNNRWIKSLCDKCWRLEE